MRVWPFSRSIPKVAVLRLSGVIAASGRPVSGGLSAASLDQSIRRAVSMRGVKAIALAINSPGGSPVQSALISRRIRALASQKGIPIFAFLEDVAASGGYWLACAADEIFADRNSIVGSIGVISSGFGFQEAIHRIGVERRVYSQGKHKAMLDPFKAEDPEGIAMLKEIQKEIYEDFIEHVQERRGKRLNGHPDILFNGDVWTGKRALELGLVDGLGDLYSITRQRFGEEVRLKFVEAPKSWFRRRMGVGQNGLLNGHFPAEFVDKVWCQVEAQALWSRYGL